MLKTVCVLLLVRGVVSLSTPAKKVDTIISTVAVNRRSFAQSLSFLPLVFAGSPPAHAVKGAAQLDAEFYLKRILDGNKPSQPVAPPTPARHVDANIVRLFETGYFETLSRTSGKPEPFLRERLVQVLDYHGPEFQERAPFEVNDLTNSRAVNFRVYAWWKLVSEVLKTNRSEFAFSFGKHILEVVSAQEKDAEFRELLFAASTTTSRSQPVVTVERVTRSVGTFLERFQEAGLLESFSLTIDEDAQEDDWDNGNPLSAQVSLVRPVALSASLQLSAEARPIDAPGTPQLMSPIDRFRPDLATLGLIAIFQQLGVEADFDEYFFDETYREDPNDTQPTALLQQWSLAPP